MTRLPTDQSGWPGCGLFLLAAVCFALAIAVLGWRALGQLAILTIFVTSLARGLRCGSFDPLLGPPLRRDSAPAAYWAIVLFNAAMVAFALWMLADELRRPAA